MISTLACTHMFKFGGIEGYSFMSQMVGRPQGKVHLRRYLSVTVKVCWQPRRFLK